MGKRKAAIVIDEVVWRTLRVLAKRGGTTSSQLIEDMVRKEVWGFDKDPAPAGIRTVIEGLGKLPAKSVKPKKVAKKVGKKGKKSV